MQVLLHLLDAVQLLQLVVRQLRGDNKDSGSHDVKTQTDILRPLIYITEQV